MERTVHVKQSNLCYIIHNSLYTQQLLENWEQLFQFLTTFEQLFAIFSSNFYSIWYHNLKWPTYIYNIDVNS